MAKNVNSILDVDTKVISDISINIKLNRDSDDLSEDGKSNIKIIHAEFYKTISDAVTKADKELAELFEKEIGPIEEEATVKTNSKSESEGIMDLLRIITGVIRRDSSPYNDSGNPFKGCPCPECRLLSDLIEDKEVSSQRIINCDDNTIILKLQSAVDDRTLTPEEAIRVSSKIRDVLEKE